MVLTNSTKAENDQQQKSFGKILLKVDLDDEIMEWSNEKIIGGLKWCFKAKLDAHENGKMMFLISIGGNKDDCLYQLWFSKVHFSLDSPKQLEAKTKYFFNGYDYTTLVEATETKMNFILNMEVLWSSPYNKFMKGGFSLKPKFHRMMDLDTDLRFSLTTKNNKNVDKSVVKVIPVNKFALASISGYFKNLFFDKLSEECSLNANSFDINEEANFDWKAFELMVYSTMAMRLMIHESEMLTDNLATKILKLSIKYDIPMMQNYCEQYLIKSETCSKMELLEIGEQLGIEKLMEHALAAITLLDFSKDFDKNSEIRAQLSEKTTKLLDKKLEKKANEWKEFVARK